MIALECNYSKKLGLPGYSSHQFSINLRTEIADLTQVQSESARLYKILQEGVDTNIKESGFLPASNGNGRGQGSSGNGSANAGTGGTGHSQGSDGAWNCSPKQQSLIEKIVAENHLDKKEVEALAQERFGKGVRGLNKLEASGLIEELFEKTGQNKGSGRGRFQGRFQRAGGR